MRRRQGAKVKHFHVSNVIYHKFSHGAVSYMLNGENVKVMSEFGIINLPVPMYRKSCCTTLSFGGNFIMSVNISKMIKF